MSATRDYVLVADVAEMFHVSTKTVARWAVQGRLPYVRTLGGHRRFPRAELERIRATLENDAAVSTDRPNDD